MNNDQYKGQVHDLVRRLSELGKRQLELTNSINSRKTALSDPLIKKAPQQGTQARFYQRKEPTVLFGNIKSGWEDDFSDKLKVRLQEQGMYFLGYRTTTGHLYTNARIHWMLSPTFSRDHLLQSTSACFELHNSATSF